MEAVALGQHRIDERRGDVDAAATRLEHPLHELLDLGRAQHRVGQLVLAVPSDEDLAGIVDPDLLDARIVEVGLQWSEAGDPRDQLPDDRLRIRHRRDLPGQAPLVMSTHHLLGDAAYDDRLRLWIDTVTTDDLTHPCVELTDQRSVCVGNGAGHWVPVPEMGWLPDCYMSGSARLTMAARNACGKPDDFDTGGPSPVTSERAAVSSG